IVGGSLLNIVQNAEQQMQTALPPVRNVEVLFRTFIIPARITVHTLIPTGASSNSSISSNITIRISRHTATAGSRCPGKTLAYSQGISFFVLFFPLSPVVFMASTG